MGRGVEVRNDALIVAYADWEPAYEDWKGWMIELAEDMDEEYDEEEDFSEERFYDDYFFHQSEWESRVEDFIRHNQELFPSLTPADRWAGYGSETHVVLENELVEFGIANYSGMTALTVAPKDHGDYYETEAQRKGLAARWAQQIEPKFMQAWSMYAKLGTFSNGESVYTKEDASA